jgi:hypothetical protein
MACDERTTGVCVKRKNKTRKTKKNTKNEKTQPHKAKEKEWLGRK